MVHPTKLTPETRERFLLILSETGNVTAAAANCGVARQSLYAARDADPAFAAAWAAAYELGTDAMEDEAIRRATQGYDKPVFYQGVECGKVREYSDVLLIFQLKGRRPDKYRERTSTELSAPGGGPVALLPATVTDPVEAARVYQRVMRGDEPA